MNILVFDLDDTLLPSNTYNEYEDININIKLYNLFTYFYSKNVPIYIYTNGTLSHAVQSLKQLRIFNLTKGIFARDNIPYMKPTLDSFKFVNKQIKMKYPYSNIYFFDDMYDNCKTALLVKWNSILINPNHNNYKYGFNIGYNSIYEAFNI